MLKLTQRHPNPFALVILLEGRLDACGARDLEGMVAQARASGGTSLDLSGLSGMDDDGRRALVALRQRGLRLEGGSLYIRDLLKEC